jgi:hypothetical protein
LVALPESQAAQVQSNDYLTLQVIHAVREASVNRPVLTDWVALATRPSFLVSTG